MQNENKPNTPQTPKAPTPLHYNTHRLTAVLYDIPMLVISVFIFLYLAPSVEVRQRLIYIAMQFGFAAVCVFSARIIAGVYRQILRYGGSRLYIRLILADVCAGAVYYGIQLLLPEGPMRVTFIRAVCVISFNLLEAVASRLLYQFVFEYGSRSVFTLPGIRNVVHFMTGYYSDEATEQVLEKKKEIIPAAKRKKLAVVGAGRIGAMLVKELLTNQYTAYAPVCFIDNDKRKAEREIYGIPVLPEDDNILSRLKALQVEEIVFALPRMHAEQKNELYERYRKTGCKILIYDYPLSQTSEFGKRTLREFRIEELLFRDAKEFMNDDVRAFYAGKTILVTGGGGSIGSELCRQIAKMSPKKFIVLDVYENSAYDLQQELIMTYGRGMLPFEVEICSVTDRRKLEHIFDLYRPDVVLHAAAHKHVPLMEHNVTEAVENNIFGTRNVIDLAIKYHVGKFLMVSTDKRIIRYFMTIPEATQLVLTCGALSENGELFALDMGKPMSILSMAENMIRLSGLEPYRDIDIVEIGLRPGEKLYEELLIDFDKLQRTQNDMIFVEHDAPLTSDEITAKLATLHAACDTLDDKTVYHALQSTVPTFHPAEEVNQEALKSREFQMASES